jgi:hypothetical protein
MPLPSPSTATPRPAIRTFSPTVKSGPEHARSHSQDASYSTASDARYRPHELSRIACLCMFKNLSKQSGLIPGDQAVRVRGHFPTDKTGLKLLFPVLNLAVKGWRMPVREWADTKAPFAVFFKNRFTSTRSSWPCTAFLTIPRFKMFGDGHPRIFGISARGGCQANAPAALPCHRLAHPYPT